MEVLDFPRFCKELVGIWLVLLGEELVICGGSGASRSTEREISHECERVM